MNRGHGLHKTTIVIWTDFDPQGVEIDHLAEMASREDAYCSRRRTTWVEWPTLDPDWDGTEFFGAPEEVDAPLPESPAEVYTVLAPVPPCEHCGLPLETVHYLQHPDGDVWFHAAWDPTKGAWIPELAKPGWDIAGEAVACARQECQQTIRAWHDWESLEERLYPGDEPRSEE